MSDERPAANGNEMIFCTYCGQSFGRYEHLERHILRHTNVKPFQCNVCYRSFTRRDLLKKHCAVHGNSEKPQALDDVNRVKIACTQCDTAKTKCDKKFPCSRCTAKSLPCEMRKSHRSFHSAKAKPTVSNEVNDHSDRFQDVLQDVDLEISPVFGQNPINYEVLPHQSGGVAETANMIGENSTQPSNTILWVPEESTSAGSLWYPDLPTGSSMTDPIPDWSMWNQNDMSLYEEEYNALGVSSSGMDSILSQSIDDCSRPQTEWHPDTPAPTIASVLSSKDVSKDDERRLSAASDTTTTVERNGIRVTATDSLSKFEVRVEVIDEAVASQYSSNVRTSLNSLLGQFAAGFNSI